MNEQEAYNKIYLIARVIREMQNKIIRQFLLCKKPNVSKIGVGVGKHFITWWLQQKISHLLRIIIRYLILKSSTPISEIPSEGCLSQAQEDIHQSCPLHNWKHKEWSYQ